MKRKRSDETTDNEDARSQHSDREDGESEDGDDEGEEEEAPKQKPKTKGKRKTSDSISKGPPVPKKPRTVKATVVKKISTIPKPKKTPGAPRGRKKAAGANGAEFNAEQVAKDAKISSDNALFSEYTLLSSLVTN